MDDSLNQPDPVSFKYKFAFNNGRELVFSVKLDPKTQTLVTEKKESYPEWTKLSHHQCLNCPLNEKESPRCPVAVNLSDLVEVFKKEHSISRVTLEIATETRSYVKETALAEGLSSLVGIYMVTSGCPILDKFKPMVQTHLPFATWQETFYRVVSMYLLAQYFLYKQGGKPDWDMTKLVDLYEDVRGVNARFSERLRETVVHDATLNALVQLDCFAGLASSMLQSNRMDSIQKLFSAHLFPSKG